MSAIENYIPKEATQQSIFLKKYPKYDGRGIKIAIIDSDVVDKSLPGMQTTSTGLPKVIECIGKSGLTVDTSTIVKSDGKGFIIGSSGRKFQIPSSYKNPSDEWHIGFTTFVHPQLNDDEDESYCEGNENFKEVSVPTINNKESPTINVESGDCIVWYDGEKWQACIDTIFTTNLEDLKILTNFDDGYEIAYLPNKLPYCINIHDDGNTLQILRPHHDHGTLVIHVVAAYFTDKPESNGLAPGAQIISMRSGITLEADLLKCIEFEVDIVNLSFSFPVTASIIQIIKKMVEEHGIIITYAAGNEGPFYSSFAEKTFEILDFLFVIGAIYPEEMREGPTHYPQSRNSVYDYSSKGPILSSGARGVDFVAPGLAITDLPKWYPDKNRSCSGTSFAAPNAAGSIACLLSGLRASSIPYSLILIKRALANTALLPRHADKLAFGNGIIQIKNAFEFIKKSINVQVPSLIPISIDQPMQKGIVCYQSKSQSPQEYRYYVNINPSFNTQWKLKTSKNGSRFITHYKTDSFFIVKIDTNLLEEGSINYAEIYGNDSTDSSMGPLFYLPITVICPADSFINKSIMLLPGPATHYFFKIPSNSQKCCIEIVSSESNTMFSNDEINIALEHRQRKKESPCWCGEHDSIEGEHELKFTAEKRTKILLIDVEKDETNLFEICLYSFVSTAFKFKLNINFKESF